MILHPDSVQSSAVLFPYRVSYTLYVAWYHYICLCYSQEMPQDALKLSIMQRGQYERSCAKRRKEKAGRSYSNGRQGYMGQKQHGKNLQRITGNGATFRRHIGKKIGETKMDRMMEPVFGYGPMARRTPAQMGELRRQRDMLHRGLSKAESSGNPTSYGKSRVCSILTRSQSPRCGLSSLSMWMGDDKTRNTLSSSARVMPVTSQFIRSRRSKPTPGNDVDRERPSYSGTIGHEQRSFIATFRGQKSN